MLSEFLFRNVPATASGLAIKAGGNADAKTTATTYYTQGSTVRSVAAQATLDLSTASGTLVIPTAQEAFVLIQIDEGTISFVVGDAVTTVANTVSASIPMPDQSAAILGAILIQNASGSNFTVGTTALDTGSVTTLYVTDKFYLYNYAS